MNNTQKVILEPNSTTLTTSLNSELRCIYSGKDYSTSKYIMTLESALNVIEYRQAKKYDSPWVEITEDQYMEMLEALPPREWNTTYGVNIFAMCEFTEGPYTAHYAKYAGKYYTATRDFFMNRHAMAEQLKKEVD